MKTALRHAPIFAGILLTFVVVAFLDRVPDNPGEFKQRRIQQDHAIKALNPIGFDTKFAAFPMRAAIFEEGSAPISCFDVECMAASAGILDLRSAADSSPPSLAA